MGITQSLRPKLPLPSLRTVFSYGIKQLSLLVIMLKTEAFFCTF